MTVGGSVGGSVDEQPRSQSLLSPIPAVGREDNRPWEQGPTRRFTSR